MLFKLCAYCPLVICMLPGGPPDVAQLAGQPAARGAVLRLPRKGYTTLVPDCGREAAGD